MFYKSFRGINVLLITMMFVLFILTFKRNSVYKDGESLWKDIMKTNSSKKRVIYNYANYLYKQNRFEESKKIISELSDDNYRKYLILANIEEKTNKDWRKIRDYARISYELKENPDSLIILAKLYIDLNEIESAGKVLDQLKPMLFKISRVNVQFAKYFIIKNELNKALEVLEGIDTKEAYFYKALTFQRVGENEKAKKYYLKSKEIGTAMVNYAIILIQEGKTEKAKKILNEINDEESKKVLEELKQQE